MSKLYSSGEVASLLNTTVRTVQYYDKRKLVCPSQISEGGRRLYSVEDVNKLKVVCFLRDAGFSINAVKDFLKEENSPKVMEMLIDEQVRELETEIEENKNKLAVLEDVRKVIKGENFSMEKIAKVDTVKEMKNKKNLRKVRTIMLTVGIIAELVEDALIAIGAIYDKWWMIVVGAVFALATAVWISTYYFKSVNYKCPECGTVFKPKFWSAFFAPHTFRTRTLTCPNCSKTSRCLEVYDDKTEIKVENQN